MTNSNTGTTKRRKIHLKLASFIQLNEQIITKYGSFNKLRSQRSLFYRSRIEKHRSASNDYKNYMKWKKFIENNFELAQAPLPQSGINSRSVIKTSSFI
jgi:hypothetical protein